MKSFKAFASEIYCPSRRHSNKNKKIITCDENKILGNVVQQQNCETIRNNSFSVKNSNLSCYVATGLLRNYPHNIDIFFANQMLHLTEVGYLVVKIHLCESGYLI